MNEAHINHAIVNVIVLLKGSVHQKLRPRLLYIIQKLFTRKWSAKHLNFYFVKGPQLLATIYKKTCSGPCTGQLFLPANVIVLHRSVSEESNRHWKLRPQTVIV